MPRHRKKSLNQAHLENDTYEQIVTHLERELELDGLEARDGLKWKTKSYFATKNPKSQNPLATTVKYKGITKTKAFSWKTKKNKVRTHKTIQETTTVHPQTVTPPPITTITTTTTIQKTENLEMSALPVRRVAKRISPQKDNMFESMQQTGHFPGKTDQKDRLDFKNRTHSFS